MSVKLQEIIRKQQLHDQLQARQAENHERICRVFNPHLQPFAGVLAALDKDPSRIHKFRPEVIKAIIEMAGDNLNQIMLDDGSRMLRLAERMAREDKEQADQN